MLLAQTAAWAGPTTIASDSDFAVATWRSEDGLPHDNVNCLLQTRDGYIWAGTPMGLAKFDGVKFENYSGGDFPKLSGNRVTSLLEGRDGTIWVALESGRVLTYRNEHFENHISPGSPKDAIVGMAEDAEGTVWLKSANGVLSCAPAGTNTVRIIPDIFATGLAADANQQIWVSTQKGLRRIQNGSAKILPGLAEMGGQRIDLVFAGQGGTIWAVREQKLWQIFQGQIHRQLEIPKVFGEVKTAIEATDNRLWIWTTAGRLLCRDVSGKFNIIGPADGLRGNAAMLLEDREGDIWCGSYGGGLNRIRPRIVKWHSILLPNGTPAYAFNVCSDQAGNVWARLEAQILVKSSVGEDSPVIQNELIVPPAVRALFCEHNEDLWLGANGGNLYHRDNHQFEPVLKMGDRVTFISAIFEDRQDNLWVGVTGGPGVGVLPKGNASQWKPLVDFPVKDVRAIAEGQDGSMWFGTYYGGAVRLKDGQYTTFTTRDGLPSDYVRCLLSESDGTIWMGTLRGICCYRNHSLRVINTKVGLWNDAISYMLEDRAGNFWISSFGGVFRVAKNELHDFVEGRISAIHCIGYNRNDGLPALECPGGFQPAGTITPDGHVWFPTEAGLVSLDTRNITFNSNAPPVKIEKFLVESAARPVVDDNALEKIGPGKHHLEFQFTALSFVSPEKVRFSHQLEGLETTWSLPDDRRTVTYDFLPAGKYVFKVKACNNDGVWDTAAATLPFSIQPFFWQTSWFIIGVALALAAGLFAAVREWEQRKLRRRLGRIERQEALARDRARIAQDIHDDAGATLAQIAFLSERIENSRQMDEISALNRRIESAARQTIQSIDEIVWAVSPKHDTLESVADYLASFMQEHLELAGIRCVIDVPPVLEPRTVRAEIRHSILLTAREALQNAVSHSRATEVRMSLAFQENRLEILIADNGCGFEIDQLRKRGNGIANMRRRLEELGGDLNIKTAPENGTLVSFSVVIEPVDDGQQAGD